MVRCPYDGCENMYNLIIRWDIPSAPDFLEFVQDGQFNDMNVFPIVSKETTSVIMRYEITNTVGVSVIAIKQKGGVGYCLTKMCNQDYEIKSGQFIVGLLRDINGNWLEYRINGTFDEIKLWVIGFYSNRIKLC